MIKTVSLIAAGLVFSLWTGAAAADVVGPAPATCPEGSRPDACHGGPFCFPLTCTQDADCTGGLVCRDRQLCLGELSCAGGFTDPDAAPPMTPQITGACASGASCDAPSACTPMKVCVSEGGTATGGGSTGTEGGSGDGDGDGGSCNCGVAGAPGGVLTALGALAAAGAVFAARRQRPSQRRR